MTNEDNKFDSGGGGGLATSDDPFLSSVYGLSPSVIRTQRNEASGPTSLTSSSHQFDFETLPTSPDFTSSCSHKTFSPTPTAFHQGQTISSSPRFPLSGEASEYTAKHKIENSTSDLTGTQNSAQKGPHFQEPIRTGQWPSPATSDLSTSSVRFSPYDSISNSDFLPNQEFIPQFVEFESAATYHTPQKFSPASILPSGSVLPGHTANCERGFTPKPHHQASSPCQSFGFHESTPIENLEVRRGVFPALVLARPPHALLEGHNIWNSPAAFESLIAYLQSYFVQA
jgi:hypothetical protein